ncbi:hypothetical protein BGZ46_006337 [Entomortierella lignicola]|nr:hypothetical protein BGZ46_006337 [Entomortierella lignicola]
MEQGATVFTLVLVLFTNLSIPSNNTSIQVQSALSYNQHQKSFWILEFWPWMMTYPNLLWAYAMRIFPRKVSRSYRSSAQGRSSQSIRHSKKTSSLLASTSSTDQFKYQSSPKIKGSSSHYARRTGASSAVDTDAFSAGSGSESKPRKSKSRKPKGTEEVVQRNTFQLGDDSAEQSSPSLINLPNSEEPTVPTTSNEAVSRQDSTTSSSIPSNFEDNSASTPETAPNAIYETADDGEFISSDRRRRRRAKGARANTNNNLSDSVTKVKSSAPQDQKSVTSSTDSTSQQQPDPSALISQGTKPDPDISTSKNTQDSVIPQKHTRDKVQRQHQPNTQETESLPTHSKSTALINNNETLLRPPSDNTFVHPLHALNSTSPIVRLKPSHKRSQSAQLPSSSPWGKPQSALSNGKQPSKSRLVQTHLSDDIKESSLVSSEVEQTESQDFKNHDLFGEPSIWYSPFQSGLDISIESDREQGKHGSRPMTKPRIQVGTSSVQKKPNLPPSSFFDSSPRTPRTMPFSQQYNAGIIENEDWSIRTRSSSVAGPMTPLLESDCQDPMEYFGGSRSASSSRRGSIENNLTESLLSGRARMFSSSSTPSVTHSRQNSQPLPSPANNSGILPEAPYLLPHFTSTIVPTTLNSVNPLTQSPLNSPMLTANNVTSTEKDSIPVFVNPWESNFSYNSKHTMSDTFLPFETSSTSYNLSRDSDRDRQSSLLRLMNNNNEASATGHHDEKEAILRGFFLPELTQFTHASSLGSTETPNFQPFASVEMSLAAIVNQPLPLIGEPKYDAAELTTPFSDSSFAKSFMQEPTEKKPRYRHGRTHSGHHKSSSLGSFFTPLPAAVAVSDSSTSSMQINAIDVQDPINRPNHNLNESSRSHGNQGHESGHLKQGRHQGSGKETDGTSSSGMRRAGTDETRHRGANKHNHQDPTKSRKVSKRNNN